MGLHSEILKSIGITNDELNQALEDVLKTMSKHEQANRGDVIYKNGIKLSDAIDELSIGLEEEHRRD